MTTIAITKITRDRLKQSYRKVTKKTGRHSFDEILNVVLDELDKMLESKDAKEYLTKGLIEDIREVVEQYE